MNKIKSITIILFFLFVSLVPAQVMQIMPTYPERSFVDSTISETFPSQVSEGAIDPEEYTVGPGDMIFISISGVDEKILNLVINQEGFLYIPKVGEVDLRNKTLAESKILIVNQLNKSFKNVNYYIALNDFRKIKVSLVGDVKKSSTFIVTSNSRLLDLLKASMGLSKTSNIRNIIINSKDGSQKQCDFLSFLRLGNYSQNPFLKDGDVVIINKIDKLITISGEVKYPANYEFKENENLNDLIDMAGGLLFNAKTDSIELVRFGEDGKRQVSQYFSYDYIKNNFVQLKVGDQIIVREIPEYYIPQYVVVSGKVRYPGYYKIVKDKTTLSEIIKEAGGFLNDASLVDASLSRVENVKEMDPEFERIKLIPRADMTDDEYDYYKSRSRQRGGKVVVDFVKLFKEKNLSEDVILKKGDVIDVPDKKNYITLIGQVVNPGNIIYQPELTVKDYINLAGGFSWRALKNDIRVVKANTGEWIDADEVDRLEPGDTIWILENPPGPKFWEVFTTTLTVLGQIAAVVAATVAVIVATK